MKRLSNLVPQPLWNYFEEICKFQDHQRKKEKSFSFCWISRQNMD